MLWHKTVVVPKVVAAGLTPKDPWVNQSAITGVIDAMEFGPERRTALQKANLAQGRYDLHLIRESQAILASLDGPDVDSGTAVEIGYGFGLDLLIVGLRTDIRRSGDNEGSIVNAMIETCVVDSDGILTDSLDTAVTFIADYLDVGAGSPKDRPGDT